MSQGKQYDIKDKFACTACGMDHEFGAWVAAHWDMVLVHTCECGQKHEVMRGLVAPFSGKDVKP